MENLGLIFGYKSTEAERPYVNKMANLNVITELENILKNKYFKLLTQIKLYTILTIK